MMSKCQRIAMVFSFLFFSFIFVAQASNYELKNMTPAVEEAIKNRQTRYLEIQTLKAGGLVGESNRGYLEVLKTKRNAEQLVSDENQDRKTIYEAIASQNELGSTGLAVIETVFSEVQHEKTKKGNYYQTSSGEWVQK